MYTTTHPPHRRDRSSKVRSLTLVPSQSSKIYPLPSRPIPSLRPAIAPDAPQRPHLQTAAANKPRRRGVILTDAGWQKLLDAKLVYNPYGERVRFESLSSQVTLDPRTICRIIDREIGVDKRTLNTFFTAFNLTLEESDYVTLATYERENHSSQQSPVAKQPSPQGLPDPKVEISDLKQRIINNCHRLALLLGIDRSQQTTLSVTLSPHAQPQFQINLQQQFNLQT